MPDIVAYTTPLSGSAHNNRAFQWTPLLDKCFESIKALATKTPVDFSSNEPVWVITDSFKTGVSAVYGQGKEGTLSPSQISIYNRCSAAPEKILHIQFPIVG